MAYVVSVLCFWQTKNIFQKPNAPKHASFAPCPTLILKNNHILQNYACAEQSGREPVGHDPKPRRSVPAQGRRPRPRPPVRLRGPRSPEERPRAGRHRRGARQVPNLAEPPEGARVREGLRAGAPQVVTCLFLNA